MSKQSRQLSRWDWSVVGRIETARLMQELPDPVLAPVPYPSLCRENDSDGLGEVSVSRCHRGLRPARGAVVVFSGRVEFSQVHCCGNHSFRVESLEGRWNPP